MQIHFMNAALKMILELHSIVMQAVISHDLTSNYAIDQGFDHRSKFKQSQFIALD